MHLETYSLINVAVLYDASEGAEIFDWWDTVADNLWDGASPK